MNYSEAYYHTFNSIEPLYGKDEAKAITKMLFSEKYNTPALLLFNNNEFPFEDELNSIVSRLMLVEPIQYILGYTYFGGLKIGVNRHVLIPRPETEELILWAKESISADTKVIADICTGSGCIALAIRKLFSDKKIFATDISAEALATARANEALNFKGSGIQFEVHDILSKTLPFEQPEIVICNPPYIEKKEASSMGEHVLKHEPHLALFVEDSDALLFYKAVIQTFLHGVFPKIFFEINPLFCSHLVAYCVELSLKCDVRKDMQGKERFAIVSK